jgi:uncharacterized membrane protein YciS (DUF1049 family)
VLTEDCSAAALVSTVLAGGFVTAIVCCAEQYCKMYVSKMQDWDIHLQHLQMSNAAR